MCHNEHSLILTVPAARCCAARSKGRSTWCAVVEKAIVEAAGTGSGRVLGAKGQSDEGAVRRRIRGVLSNIKNYYYYYYYYGVLAREAKKFK